LPGEKKEYQKKTTVRRRLIIGVTGIGRGNTERHFTDEKGLKGQTV